MYGYGTITKRLLDDAVQKARITLASTGLGFGKVMLSWHPYHCLFVVTIDGREVYRGNDKDKAVTAYNPKAK